MLSLKPSHYVSLAAVLAVTTVGGYLGYQRLAPSPAAAARVVTAEVAQGPIVASVSATGSVATPAQSKLSFKSGGRLTQLLVGIGDRVEEGQALAVIDDSELQIALQQAQANVRSAQAKLEQTKAGAKPEDIQAAQAQVEAARIKLNQTRSAAQGPDLTAAQSQLASAQSQLDQVLAGGRPEAVAAAQAQLDAATQKLIALQQPRPEDLAAAQSQVTQAQLKLAQLTTPRPEDVRNAEAALTAARAKLTALQSPRPEDLAAAQSQLDQAKTKLAQLVDQPQTAKPEDLANAELAVKTAEVGLDKARADATKVNLAKTSSEQDKQAAEASVQQALLGVQTAQNNLGKLKAQGPSAWDLRLAQQAVEAAQLGLDKLRSPAPADVQAAQAGVAQAQTSLDKLTTPSPFDVQAAQEAITQAQAGLDQLRHPAPADVAAAQQAVLAAQASLDQLVTPSAYDVQAAQQAVVQAQAGLDKLLNSSSYDIQTAQNSVQQAQLSLNLKAAPPTVQDIAIAEAALDQAQVQLNQAQANLAGATLTAPFAGSVAALGANVGEQVASGTPPVTLVDTRQVRVDVVVDETDVAKVQVGQPANVTFEALTGQRLAGKVLAIAPVATVQQGVVNYTVQVQLDPAQSGRVRPGMTATAQIVTASKDDAVLVPNRAVRTQGRTRTVEVLGTDGKTSSRPVQTGMANDQMTEIVSGVLPGDRVVIPSTTTAQARVPGLSGAGPVPGGAVVVRR